MLLKGKKEENWRLLLFTKSSSALLDLIICASLFWSAYLKSPSGCLKCTSNEKNIQHWIEFTVPFFHCLLYQLMSRSIYPVIYRLLSLTSLVLLLSKPYRFWALRYAWIDRLLLVPIVAFTLCSFLQYWISLVLCPESTRSSPIRAWVTVFHTSA